MGGTFKTAHFETTTPEQVQEQWERLIVEEHYEYGHDPYNGSFTTCDGLEITDLSFPNHNAADDWLSRNTRKREAKAVKVPDGWLIGGWCAM